MRTTRALLTAVVLLIVSTLPASGADVQPLLKTLQAVGPQGAGHREAAQAWKQLAQAEAAELPVILAGLDDAGPLAANWIRTAVDAIAERELKQGGELPAAEIEQFVLDKRHNPRGRRLAYELLSTVDPAAKERLIPAMLDDPSLEMRRDAVARLTEEADGLAKGDNKDQALPRYQTALSAARDLDQVNLLAERLRKLGQTVSLPRHFGFIVRWRLIGPFDNTDDKGYDTVYPPEEKLDAQAEYDGTHGKVRWIDYTTSDDYGQVDFNKALGKEKSVVGYATTEFVAEKQQEVEFRMASANAPKLWVNGRLVLAQHIYHAGSQMDQYIARAVLAPGSTQILVKACQNAQTQEWTENWGFQLRVCDANGTAILSTDHDK